MPDEHREQLFGKIAGQYDNDISVSEDLAGITALRKTLLASATGTVLEVGAGTGRNVGAYPAACSFVVLSDNSAPMLEVCARKVRIMKQDKRMAMAQFSSSAIPYAAASFDTVVSTFTYAFRSFFCTRFPIFQNHLFTTQTLLGPGTSGRTH